MGVQERGGEAAGPEQDVSAAFDDLLDAAQRGQPAALSELWSSYAGGVASYIRARGAVEVDEITNDVFLAVFTTLADFTGDASGFTALLFTIAKRRVIDEQRRRGRQRAALSWWPFDDRRSAESPEVEVLGREASGDLLSHINRLTDDQRDVVLLRLVAELSIEEVAATLGRTPGSVKSLQRRGLDSLRRYWPGMDGAVPPDQHEDRAHDPEGPRR